MKNIINCKAVILDTVLFIILSFFTNEISAQIPKFYQIDFYFPNTQDSLIDSDWGEVIIETPYYNEVRYFNLAIDLPGINTSWQVRNLPIVSKPPEWELQKNSCYFDIGNLGTEIIIINYGISITLDTIGTEPIINNAALVESFRIEFDFGEIVDDSEFINTSDNGNIQPATFIDFGKTTEDRIGSASEFHLFNQKSLPNGCAPNAISNSLNYLLNRNRRILGEFLKDTSITKERIAKAIGWKSDRGTAYGWWDRKNRYLNDTLRVPIITRTFQRYEIGEVLNELNRGQDVEIYLGGVINNKPVGHTAMVTDIFKINNDEFFINFQITSQGYNNTLQNKHRECCLFNIITNRVSFHPVYIGLFSPAFIVECPVDSVLPVNLTTFDYQVSINKVILKWITNSENNNYGFKIERSCENSEFISIGFVNGYGSTNNQTNYVFEDKNLQPGRYYYRLKQMDYNGNYQYYDLKNAVIICKPDKFNLQQNYPNPFNPVTTINYELPENGFVKISIYDNTGREIKTLVNEHRDAGYYSVQFNGSEFASGVYFCKLQAGNYIASIKMIIVK